MSDQDLIELGKAELETLGLVKRGECSDGCVVRMEKAYPVYGPGYQNDVAIIRRELSTLENILPVGRNGMHKYNNQDHSMMTTLLASRNLTQNGNFDLWKVNTDAEYHEDTPADDLKTGRLVPGPIEDAGTLPRGAEAFAPREPVDRAA